MADLQLSVVIRLWGEHTLNTTALVHEAYLKLANQASLDEHNQGQFFAVASMAMRRILVDHARKHATAKRGGERVRVPRN